MEIYVESRDNIERFIYGIYIYYMAKHENE